MNFIKKYFKIFIGCGALILAVLIFAGLNVGNIDSGMEELKDWRTVSMDRKQTAIKMMVGTDNIPSEQMQSIIECVDKYAQQSENAHAKTQVAVTMCYNSMGLKEYL